MKLENQVVNLELAQKMKEIGFKQESYFHWYIPVFNGDMIFKFARPDTSKIEPDDVKWCSAYTVAELGELLGEHFHRQEFWNQGKGKKWMVEGGEKKSINYEYETKRMFADTEADARAKMLIYLVENKLITN